MHVPCLTVLITPSCRYNYYLPPADEKHHSLKVKYSWWLVCDRGWDPGVVKAEAPVMSAGSCYFDPLQSDFSLTTHRRVCHLFWNVEDLAASSACFGRVNRARCLSAVDASEHGNLSSPWRAGLVQRLAFSLGHWSVNRCSKYSWLTSCQSPILQQWTTSSVIWKLITDLQYWFAFFPKQMEFLEQKLFQLILIHVQGGFFASPF